MRHTEGTRALRTVTVLVALCAVLAGCDSRGWGFRRADGLSRAYNSEAEYTRQLERELTRSSRGR